MILPYKEAGNMNTSSFLCGVLIGAAASMIMSKKRSSLLSSLGQSGGSLGGATDKATEKIISMATTGFGNTSASGKDTHSKESSSGASAHKADSSGKSKESNLNLLKDFIRSNPDVKSEVEQILKESHTVIPGL
jgi:gas vesicle protein